MNDVTTSTSSTDATANNEPIRIARKAVKKRDIYRKYNTIDEVTVRLVIHDVIDPVRYKKHYVLATEADEIYRILNGESEDK